MSDLRNLGLFASVDALWAEHPEGGQEGDYAFIGETEQTATKYRWNKYERIWENAATVTETSGKKSETFDGDKTINGNVSVGGNVKVTGDTKLQGNASVSGNLKVGGVLDAAKVKQPCCGLFDTLTALRAAYPTPEDGWWAVVGGTVPGPIYRAKNGVWSATGEEGGGAELDVTRITNIEEKNVEQDEKISELQTNDTQATRDRDTLWEHVNNIEYLLNGEEGENVSEAIENFKEVVDFLAGVKDNSTLTALLEALKAMATNGYSFKGIAKPESRDLVTFTELKPTQPEAYLALSEGTYWQFGWTSSVITGGDTTTDTPRVLLGANEVAFVLYNNHWSAIKIDLAKKTYVDSRVREIEKRLDNIGEEITALNVPAAIYNPTVEHPLSGGGYYNLEDNEHPSLSAVHVAKANGKAVKGLMMSFAISATVWKTFQFVGLTTEDVDWFNIDNWKDFGSLAAGSENYIIIDNLCGAPSVGNFYNLQSAVERLIAYQQTSGVTYAKRGLIISYLVAENTMETKMFNGAVADFSEVGLWKDFGGGGSKVETKDEPQSNGKDAFSTGGAYKLLPTGIRINTEEEGIVKLALVNANGEDITDEEQFSVGTGTGGGGGSATIVNINFEESPLYGNAGGNFTLRASIRSITVVGQEEQENTINAIELYDRDTNTLLEKVIVNKASSATSQTYDFVLDVSKYFSNAGVRRFKLVATDDTDHSASRNINVTAVDVTISSVQTLQYTSSTALVAGGASKSIPLYKFANNASDKGINAITEIYLGGEWKELGQAIITDTYSHGISINPSNCLGQTLSHGAYPIRVHGVDVASGVVGNYLYSGIFVIDASSVTPLVVESWISNTVNPIVKLYDTIEVQYAVYSPSSTFPTAQVYLDGVQVQSHTAYRSVSYTYRHQVTGVASDGSVSQIVKVRCGETYGPEASFLVSGSVIDAVLKDGAIYAFDFSNRSNDEEDHTIESGGQTIVLNGSNWSTTGFKEFNGEMSLRFAEDVTGSLNHRPFSKATVETNGLGIQFKFASKNLTDDNAVLMECRDANNGAGFYVTGRAVGIQVGTSKEERFYKQGEEITVDIVVEPAAEGLGQTRNGTTYYFMKLYLNGEEVAVLSYISGQSNLVQNSDIRFYGTEGDFYLFYCIAWEDYFLFDQAFQNYLVKLTDTTAMAEEYNFEDVMASQAVTELGILSTKLRPQAAALAERGMPYIIECPYNGSNIEALDETTSTKTNNYVTLYYIDPTRPWTSFVAYDVRRRNQGTTSAKRPVKNPRYYFAKKYGSTYDKATKTGGTRIQLLYTREQIVAMGYDGALWDKAAALAAINKVQIHEDSIPVDIITVKVDFSDSSNANDCGVCDMMNATFRALGGQYLTPAQRAYDGTWKSGSIQLDGLVMNHSTANFPVAMFRSKSEAGTEPYFHSKGNWKEDKKEQTALGFINTPGYTLGCLNYGDFKEFYGQKGESLADEKSRFLATSGLDTGATYILTQYCGPSYIIMEHNGSTWEEQTGSMVQNANGKWTVTGKVLNPTDGFELLNYQGMDWFKGVSSVDDLMAPSTQFSKWVQQLIDDGEISINTAPAWTYYFESLVDDDDLAIAYALGKKVPYNLLRWMMFCDTCDYDKYADAALARWRTDLWKYASPHSCFAYDIFTDYKAAVDQRAKNMQPMWFLEDGCKIVNGEFFNADNEKYEETSGMMPMRMYLNKVYDCDTCNGKDNDGGQTIDAEVDPNRMPDETFVNPYAGYNSTLFRNIYLQPEVVVDATGTLLNLQTVASAMRSCTATVDGITLHPFSPEGAKHFFIDQRIARWPKKVSSYDGERKYIDFTSTTADTLYFYALQGLGLTSLPAFIERRYRYRDGFFGTGDFFSGVLAGRVNAPVGATIKIKAAKSGYFGIGNDSSGSLSEKVYLEAGQEYSFTNFSHEEGALLYIYQADRMSMIDLSQIALSDNFSFAVMTLAEKIVLGFEGKQDLSILSYSKLTNLQLGELPFLKTLDIRGTIITNVNAESCPRLESLYAASSQLTRADIADGAKITLMQLPSTYSYLKLRYLPNMTIDGIILSNPASIRTLIVENNAKIDSAELLRIIAGATGSALRIVRATPVNISGNGDELEVWRNLGMSGLDANLTAQDYPAIVGTYQLTKFQDDEQIATWQAALPELKINNTTCTVIEFDDSETDCNNISNLDNETGYKFGNDYVPSGHVTAILAKRHAVLGKLQADNTMLIAQLDDNDRTLYADGSAANLKGDRDESLADEGDAFIFEPHYFYKGINDYLNNKKYHAFSSLDETPQDPGKDSIKVKLSELVCYDGRGLSVSAMELGAVVEDALTVYSTYNVYKIDVEGVKVIRFPACVSGTYGAAFADEVGNCVGVVRLGSLNGYVNGDYLFKEVPAGAKTLYFTTVQAFDANCFADYCVKAFSSEITAVEPDWVEHDECLCAIYEANCSNDIMRSISGVAATNNMQCGQYTEMAAARKSGSGFQCVDYEMSKDVANLFYAKYGTRDSQMQCGYGSNTTASIAGKTDFLGMRDTINPNGETNYGYYYNSLGTLTSIPAVNVMGYENWQGDSGEWMDTRRVGLANGAKVSDSLGASRSTKVGVWQIKMNDGTTREVQGQTATSNYISRVVNGRFMDVIASYANATSTSGYADYHYYSGSASRVVLRSYYNANAYGGVACASAVYDSSGANASCGSRLAFRGKIRWAKSVEEYKAAPMAA